MPSEPARNLVHGLLLAVWAAVGFLVTLGAFAHPATTVGDLHDAHRLTARIDEARVTKLIAEHDPLKPAI